MSAPETVGLADGVEDLAQDVLVLEVVRAAAGEPGDVLALELVDLASGGPLEGGVQGVAAVQLHGVDEEAHGAVAPSVAVDVAEQGELAGRRHRLAARERAVVAGNPVVDELAHAGVGAHDDEHRWAAHPGAVPLSV